MTTEPAFTIEQFTACGWEYDTSSEEQYGYSTVMQSLQSLANEKRESGDSEQASLLDLLARASSMMMVPGSINEPFRPYFQDFSAGRRSAIPEDFTEEELVFFEALLTEVEDVWVRARLADLLWLCRLPKNPKHARIAIDAYMSHPIDPKDWRKDIDDYWERAARLAMQIIEQQKIESIRDQLFAAFGSEYAGYEFMPLWLANLLDKLQLDSDFRADIAKRLLRLGTDLKGQGNFNGARSYLELAAKKFQQGGDEEGWLESLLSIAVCFEEEADSRATYSNIAANSFYENAIQAYRRVPVKHRDEHDVESKITSIHDKLMSSGKSSLGEMGSVKSPKVDVSEMVEVSCAHVSGKQTWDEALIYFAGLYSGPNYQSLVDSAQKSIQQSPLSGLFESIHMSSDGRVVAKVPPVNLGTSSEDPANKLALQRQIQQHFNIDVEFTVKACILPALRQILMEHRITREFMQALCHHSPIVSTDRVELMGLALWLGFEYEFGNAIHLLCPQFEHIIRVQLKEAGAHTSNIDREGIENENGLSTLMDLTEAKEIFGDDLSFEIKSIFTDALGHNLRNEAAHGLLDDRSSSSISSIYAWWMILRLVLDSIRNGSFNKVENTPITEEGQDESEDSMGGDKEEQVNEHVIKNVTSGAFTQVAIENAEKVIWRSALELTRSKNHKDNREYAKSMVEKLETI